CLFSDTPLEHLSYVAPSSGSYFLVIERFSASGSSSFDLIAPTQQSLQYQVPADSLLTPADNASPGMVSVGAVAWNAPNTLEPFSSRGPTTDGRIKPDLVGPDHVSTTTFGPGGFS